MCKRLAGVPSHAYVWARGLVRIHGRSHNRAQLAGIYPLAFCNQWAKLVAQGIATARRS